jgi:hypothetical protein
MHSPNYEQVLDVSTQTRYDFFQIFLYKKQRKGKKKKEKRKKKKEKRKKKKEKRNKK